MREDQASAGHDRPYRAFGAWLRSRRLARRLTQAQLANLLAYEVSYVRKIEWGTKRPSQAFLARTAQVFDLPADGVPSPDFGADGPRLPVPTTTLIGRIDEAGAVEDLLKSSRLVTLIGAPGIGKTRLALEVARVIETRVEGGAAFVALDSASASSEVPALVARALGLGAATRASQQAVAEHLRNRRMLLVCDNFEHVLEARTFLAEILDAAPGVRALATSREPLRISGELRYPVPPLAFPAVDALPPLATLADWPAVALFVERARAVQPDFSVTADNAHAVVATCAALDGIPLAIELTASATRLFGADALFERVDRAIDLPVSPPSDVLARQQTIAGAIDSSFLRLTDREQAVFSRLAVFAGGFSLDAAAAICSDHDHDEDEQARLATSRLVAGLVDKSLVATRAGTAAGVRLYLLEVVRQFAADQLDRRGERTEWQRRHAQRYAEWVESIAGALTGADQARHLEQLDDEVANLRAAFRWALANAPPIALRLCAATWRWWMRRHVHEGRQWFEQALEAATRAGGDVDVWRAQALNGAGVLSATLGEYNAALSYLGSALSLAEQLGLYGEVAVAHQHLGIVSEARGGYAEASTHFETAATLYRSLGNSRGVAHALNAQAAVATDVGDHQRAMELYEQSLDAFRRLGDRWSEAMVTTNLGWTALALGQPEVSEAWYDQGLIAWRVVGDERGVAAVLAGLARSGRRTGAPAGEVAGRLEEALLILAKVGDRRGAAECLEELAAVATDMGEWERAGTLLGSAAALRRVTRAALSPEERARLDGVVAEVRAHLDQKQFDRAAARGGAVALDQAIAFALRRPSVRPGV